MDAPLYPPVTHYEEPRLLPGQFNVDGVTIGELLAAPSTRPIILSDPALADLLKDPPFRHHLYNFTLRDLAAIVPGIKPAVIDRIDRELRALAADRRPVL